MPSAGNGISPRTFSWPTIGLTSAMRHPRYVTEEGERDPILSEGIAVMATPFGRGGPQPNDLGGGKSVIVMVLSKWKIFPLGRDVPR